jgi:glycosyltransferase involved in cell wall biosynthesis
MKLSAIVIAKNEANSIERCLDSLSFADEIIVVDAESTDRTVELAKQYTPHVLINPWPGYGKQKNLGRARARGEWLLFIDADEVIPPPLAKEILIAVNNPQANFYWLKVLTYFLNRPLRHLLGHNPRLFKKASGHWTNDHVHEQVATLAGTKIKLGDSLSATLNSPLTHYSHTTLRSYLQSMHRYTSLDAEQMKETGRHRSGRSVKPAFWLPYKLALRQFLKLYFYRRGFLDGSTGFIWSYLSAYYEWEMARKYLCA